MNAKRAAAVGSFGPPKDILFLGNEEGLPGSGTDPDFLSDMGLPHDLLCKTIPLALSAEEREYVRQGGRSAADGAGKKRIVHGRSALIVGRTHACLVSTYLFDGAAGRKTRVRAAELLIRDLALARLAVREAGGQAIAFTEENPGKHALVLAFPFATLTRKFKTPESFGEWARQIFRQPTKQKIKKGGNP